MTSTPERRSVHVEQVMGTVVSIDLRGAGDHPAAIRDLVAWFHEVDRRFSPFRPDSETCRFDAGSVDQPSAELAGVLTACAGVGAESGGAFSVWHGGRFDPCAYVKGWSVDCAAPLLAARGCADWSVNAGGDVRVAGHAAPGRSWRVGVRSPFDAGALVATIAGEDLAVATSGTYERGGHVVDARTGSPSTGVASVTVVAHELGLADAVSTAALALGADGAAWLAARSDCEGLVVADDGTALATRGFPRSVHGIPVRVQCRVAA